MEEGQEDRVEERYIERWRKDRRIGWRRDG
jgi:hypothetical protein